MVRIQICLFFAPLFTGAIVNAQHKQMTLGNVKMSFLNSPTTTNYLNTSRLKNVATSWQIADTSKIRFSPNSISPTFYAEHLGMMCKEELRLEKVVKFPIRIRLGSKEQVDYLEGKYYRH